MSQRVDISAQCRWDYWTSHLWSLSLRWGDPGIDTDWIWAPQTQAGLTHRGPGRQAGALCLYQHPCGRRSVPSNTLHDQWHPLPLPSEPGGSLELDWLHTTSVPMKIQHFPFVFSETPPVILSQRFFPQLTSKIAVQTLWWQKMSPAQLFDRQSLHHTVAASHISKQSHTKATQWTTRLDVTQSCYVN